MKRFKDFSTYNKYVGLEPPLDGNIDLGYYDLKNIRTHSEPIAVEFYRISMKSNYIDRSAADYDPENPKPLTVVFFNSPGLPQPWNSAPTFDGFYLQLSTKLIDENRFLFKNYLDYGQHEALYLTEMEVQEIRTIFDLMMKYYNDDEISFQVLISYAHVLISLVEAFYIRQFSTHPKQYSHILSNFQQALKDYYIEPAKQLPSVQYFADKLGLTPNYLGDIIKHFSNKSAIETIHEFVIKRARTLLIENPDLNNADIAYDLGFEYPTYFSKFFKKHTGTTPKDFRSKNFK